METSQFTPTKSMFINLRTLKKDFIGKWEYEFRLLIRPKQK